MESSVSSGAGLTGPLSRYLFFSFFLLLARGLLTRGREAGFVEDRTLQKQKQSWSKKRAADEARLWSGSMGAEMVQGHGQGLSGFLKLLALCWRFSGRYVAGAVTFPVRRIKVDHEARPKVLRLSVSPLEDRALDWARQAILQGGQR
ncbi:hypothetical protein V8C37DRAFT_387940 [Trichoderma ceciliae]